MTMSDELKELAEKINELIDRQFKPFIEHSSKIREWTSESLEVYEKIYNNFNDEPNEVARHYALSLVSSMIISLTKRQLAITEFQHQIIKELKDASFNILYLPIYTYLEMSDTVMPVIANRIKNIEKGLDSLREEGVEIALNVGEEMREDIKIIKEAIEESKKAMKKYVI